MVSLPFVYKHDQMVLNDGRMVRRRGRLDRDHGGRGGGCLRGHDRSHDRAGRRHFRSHWRHGIGTVTPSRALKATNHIHIMDENLGSQQFHDFFRFCLPSQLLLRCRQVGHVPRVQPQ